MITVCDALRCISENYYLALNIIGGPLRCKVVYENFTDPVTIEAYTCTALMRYGIQMGTDN